MKRKYQAVVWDFDGVIFDSEEACRRATNAVRAKYDLQPEAQEIHRHRPTNHSRWYIERGIPLSSEECQKSWREHYDNSTCGLVEGVLVLLNYLQAYETPSAIVSAHRGHDLQAKLDKFGIGSYFTHVYGDIWNKKETLMNVCGHFRVVPAETLFIGDLLSDVQDGKAAGVATVLFAPADSPHAAEADHHITHLNQLIPLLAL